MKTSQSKDFLFWSKDTGWDLGENSGRWSLCMQAMLCGGVDGPLCLKMPPTEEDKLRGVGSSMETKLSGVCVTLERPIPVSQD